MNAVVGSRNAGCTCAYDAVQAVRSYDGSNVATVMVDRPDPNCLYHRGA